MKINLQSLVFILLVPLFLSAQYTGGDGRGDATISVTNAHIHVRAVASILPTRNELFQNYPNPFNPKTTIRFQIKDTRFVSIKVYDITGKEITTLVNEKLNAGTYEVPFSISQLSGYQESSGIYFYRLITETYSETKRMILLK